MNEKLLSDYIIAEGINVYSDFEIDSLSTAGEWVMFREVEGWDMEQHKIPLLDIVAWVYSKQLKGED
jgi:hypothetical protein